MIYSNDLTKLKQHIALTACADVDSIVSQSLTNRGIVFFNYYKEFNDGSVIRLSNNGRWAEHYFRQGYINKTTRKGYVNKMNNKPGSALLKPVNFFIWNPVDWPEMQNDSAQHFDFSHGISVVKPCHDGVESFGFASATANHQIVNNFYLHNLDWLSHFCESFKDQAADLITKFEVDKIILPEFADKSALILDDDLQTPSTWMSNRQLTCAMLFLDGLTVKQIASHLKLSPRTVETHLNYLKTKFDCSNKTQLILSLHRLINGKKRP